MILTSCSLPLGLRWSAEVRSETAKRFASMTPIAQTEGFGCAAITAAHILRYYGREVNAAKLQNELRSLLGKPDSQTPLQKALSNPKLVHPELLRLLFLKYGFFTIPIVGDTERLKTLVAAGIPLVTLYGITALRQFHYAVLCGFEDSSALLLDGISGHHKIDERLFLKVWLSSGGIAFGVTPPDRIGFSLTPEEKLSLAAFWHGRGELDKAFPLYIEAASLLENRRMSAFALNNAARIRYYQNKKDEAKDILERAVEKDPEFAPALNNLAFILLETGGDLERALRLAEKALELDPANEKEYQKTIEQIKQAQQKKE